MNQHLNQKLVNRVKADFAYLTKRGLTHDQAKNAILPNLLYLQDQGPHIFANATPQDYIDVLAPQDWRLLTKEAVAEVAATVETWDALKRKNYVAWRAANLNEWGAEVCRHFKRRKKANGFWQDAENIADEARRLGGLHELCSRNRWAFDQAVNAGLMPKICELLGEPEWIPQEQCRAAALGCKSESEFASAYPAEYDAASRYGWLARILSDLMKATQTKKKRPWKCSIWDDKETCRAEAAKYQTSGKFAKGSKTAYNYAARNQWIDEFFPDPKQRNRSAFLQVKENCAAEARKYQSRKDFRRSCPGGWRIAKENGWVEEICSHMKPPQRQAQNPAGHWNNYDNCKAVALECRSRTQMRFRYPKVFEAIKRNGWLDDLLPALPIGSGKAK